MLTREAAKKLYEATARLGLPPGGVAVTEVGLSPGGENDGAVDGRALGKSKGQGGRPADNLLPQDRVELSVHVIDSLHARPAHRQLNTLSLPHLGGARPRYELHPQYSKVKTRD